LEDTRRRTKEAVADITQDVLDWTPPAGGNTIGTLLYHLALIEADYLAIDVLGYDRYPDDLAALLPVPDRDAAGRLMVVTDVELSEHLARLDHVRQRVLDTFAVMTEEQLAQPRHVSAGNYEISPAWTLHHLMQHEAHHRGEIGIWRRLAEVATVS
jgi:uncharacterized damage-inducible protein DinB